MGHIKVDLTNTPDRMEPLPPGTYVLRVEDAVVDVTKDGNNQKVVVTMRVDDESNPSHGRMVFDHLSIKMPIGLKQLVKSAGLPVPSGDFDTADLIGKHVKARVKTRVYKDLETGEQKETASIAEYLF